MSVFVLGLALRVAGFWWLADGSGSGSGSVGTASNSLQQRVELANVMTSWKAGRPEWATRLRCSSP